AWNTYPDARVDTTSFLYQFSFEKRHRWSEYFAAQPEVLGYLRHIAVKYGVYDKIQFGTVVTDARFDEGDDRWHMDLVVDGTRPAKLTHNIVIAASGLFATAKRPEIPGMADFAGQILHTTEVPSSFDASDRTIAIMGNGSTGVQLMPKLAESA